MRLKTLTLSLSLWVTGVAICWMRSESISLTLNISILFCMLALQVAVNYWNDVLDSKRGKDTKNRLGPERMVQLKKLTSKQMIKAGWRALSLAVVIGAYLVFKGGVIILCIGVIGLMMTYFYSAPPVQLADRGLSEIFVFLFFGVLSIFGIYYLNHIHSLTSVRVQDLMSFYLIPNDVAISLIAGAQLGFLSISVLVINHLRDYEEDKQTQKRTLTVRFGLAWGRLEFLLSILFAYLLGLYWWLCLENTMSFVLTILALPLYIYLIAQIYKEEPSRKYNFYLGLTSLAHFVFALSLSVGFIIG